MSLKYNYRSLHLDCARHFFSVETVKKVIEGISYGNLNVLHWHLTDDHAWRIESKKFPKLHESSGQYYTQEQIREIIDYAKKRGIDVIPEIDMPAHATSFTKVWPELAVQNQVSPLNGNRPLVDHIDVSKAEGVQLIKDLFDDYTTGANPTFDSETIVHIGADEFVYNYTAYRQFVNTIVPHVKETNTVRMWGGLTWINDGKTEIVADIPLSELFGYNTNLRSMTGGRGTYAYTFSRYEQAPSDVQAKVIADNEKEEQ